MLSPADSASHCLLISFLFFSPCMSLSLSACLIYLCPTFKQHTSLLFFLSLPHVSFPLSHPLFLLLFSPTPKVSWLRKDGELSETRTAKDMFDRRLRFSNISESDGGEYQCIAENSQGKVTHTYTVTVEGTSHKLHVK